MSSRKMKTLDEAISKPQVAPLWPNGIDVPVVQLIGSQGTGKSTFFAAMRDISPDLRIVALDMEGSMANIGKKYNVQVIDVRQAVYDKFYGGQPTFNYTNGQLFECWLEAATALEGGDILINDTISRVYLGANQWTRVNAKMFGKEAKNYTGAGEIFSWGDTNGILWPNIVDMLKAKFRVVAFLSHMKDEWEQFFDEGGRKSSRKTGRQLVRGVDFGELCTLVIQLARDPENPDIPKAKLQTGEHGRLWAKIVKDRIPHVLNVTKEMLAEQRGVNPNEIDDFDPELGARNVPLLPKVLIPAPGQPYHRLLFQYMLRPQLDYGELNKLVYDPSAMSDEDKEAMRREQEEAELRKAELLLKARTEERKRELVDELKNKGLYKDGLDVAKALAKLGLTYSLDNHEAIAVALMDNANGQQS